MPRIPDNQVLLPSTQYLLVSVGTTKFEHLIKALNSNPDPLLALCHRLHITDILLQIGSSSIEPTELELAAENFSFEKLQQQQQKQDQKSINEPLPELQNVKKHSLPKLTVTWASYISNFKPYLQNASLIISHAGAGTILETLRGGDAPLTSVSSSFTASKKIGGVLGAGTTVEKTAITPPKLFVVINDLLMDNHQEELAEAFASDGYLFYGTVTNCIEKVTTVDWSELKYYPRPNTNAMVGLIAHTVHVNINQGVVVPLVQTGME